MIWRAQWSWSKGLFLANRIVAPLALLVNIHSAYSRRLGDERLMPAMRSAERDIDGWAFATRECRRFWCVRVG